MSGLSDEAIDRALRGGARIQPSDPGSWPGAWRGTPAPGSRWTQEQLRVMHQDLERARAGAGRFAAATIALLRRPEDVAGHRVAINLGRAGAGIECPLLARSKDGTRLLIITPAGEKQWIDA